MLRGRGFLLVIATTLCAVLLIGFIGFAIAGKTGVPGMGTAPNKFQISTLRQQVADLQTRLTTCKLELEQVKSELADCKQSKVEPDSEKPE